MLISGVPRTVRPQDYAAQYHVDPSLFAAAIALGQDSVDTRSNAEEVARWLARRQITARSASSPATGTCPRPLRDRPPRIGVGRQVLADAVESTIPIFASSSPNITNICSAGPPACSGSEAERRCVRSFSLWSSTAARCRRSCSPSRSACSGLGRCGAGPMSGCASTAGARAICSASAAGSKAIPPARRLPGRGQAPVDVRDVRDHPDARSAGDGAEARA
jgi:hypothetical protein